MDKLDPISTIESQIATQKSLLTEGTIEHDSETLEVSARVIRSLEDQLDYFKDKQKSERRVGFRYDNQRPDTLQNSHEHSQAD